MFIFLLPKLLSSFFFFATPLLYFWYFSCAAALFRAIDYAIIADMPVRHLCWALALFFHYWHYYLPLMPLITLLYYMPLIFDIADIDIFCHFIVIWLLGHYIASCFFAAAAFAIAIFIAASFHFHIYITIDYITGYYDIDEYWYFMLDIFITLFSLIFMMMLPMLRHADVIFHWRVMPAAFCSRFAPDDAEMAPWQYWCFHWLFRDYFFTALLRLAATLSSFHFRYFFASRHFLLHIFFWCCYLLPLFRFIDFHLLHYFIIDAALDIILLFRCAEPASLSSFLSLFYFHYFAEFSCHLLHYFHWCHWLLDIFMPLPCTRLPLPRSSSRHYSSMTSLSSFLNISPPDAWLPDLPLYIFAATIDAFIDAIGLITPSHYFHFHYIDITLCCWYAPRLLFHWCYAMPWHYAHFMLCRFFISWCLFLLIFIFSSLRHFISDIFRFSAIFIFIFCFIIDAFIDYLAFWLLDFHVIAIAMLYCHWYIIFIFLPLLITLMLYFHWCHFCIRCLEAFWYMAFWPLMMPLAFTHFTITFHLWLLIMPCRYLFSFHFIFIYSREPYLFHILLCRFFFAVFIWCRLTQRHLLVRYDVISPIYAAAATPRFAVGYAIQHHRFIFIYYVIDGDIFLRASCRLLRRRCERCVADAACRVIFFFFAMPLHWCQLFIFIDACHDNTYHYFIISLMPLLIIFILFLPFSLLLPFLYIMLFCDYYLPFWLLPFSRCFRWPHYAVTPPGTLSRCWC